MRSAISNPVPLESGQYTPSSWNGFSVDPSNPINYSRVGNIVTLWMDNPTVNEGTSNTAFLSTSGVDMPPSIRPVAVRFFSGCVLTDNGVAIAGACQIATNGGLSFGATPLTSSGGFTNTGTKGLPHRWMVTYPIR